MNLARVNLQLKTLLLQANATQGVSVTGNVFVCVSSTKPFNLAVNGQSYVSWDQGWSFKLSPNELFTDLSFNNPNSVAIVINYYAASVDVSFWPDRNPSTVNKGEDHTIAGTNILTQAGVVLSGLKGPGLRKQVIISNIDASGGVLIYDSSGVPLAFLPPANPPYPPVTIETSDSITIKSGLVVDGVGFQPGAGVNSTTKCVIWETYYTS